MDTKVKKGSMFRGCPEINAESAEIITYGKGNCNKLNTVNWLSDIPADSDNNKFFEIRFKNTRKAIYYNINQLRLKVGDIVAVEASPGHDIGVISTGGPIVALQMKKLGLSFINEDHKKIYRKAKPADIDKWLDAVSLEKITMLKSRRIADDLKLDMKIGDVEYQGDKTKAIFYYIADERVDFRELIKVLADEFKIRIEMRQIGARQEAGRIGGIGSCGRELCCSTWLTNFVSVTTSAARYQEVSINPQKLAGQCSKLKCCLNYEVHCYVDAQKDFPKSTIPLETKEGIAHHHKTDIFKRTMWYGYDQESATGLKALSVDRVKEIIKLNEKGHKPDSLAELEDQNKNLANMNYNINDERLDRFEDKRNWKEYNAQLVKRGEFYINPRFLETWLQETKELNQNKVGQPFLYPPSMIEFLAILHSKGFDFRALEGIMRALSTRLGNFPVISFSQIRRRIIKLDIRFDAKSDNLIVGIDGTGIKVSNRGEWMRQKWKVRRGWIKVVVMGDTEGNIVDIRIGNENLDERSSARGMIRKNKKNIKKALMDGLHDCEDTFDLLDKEKIEAGIKIRSNACEKGYGARPREVRKYKGKDYEDWFREKEYGLRWPSSECIFSAEKRIFGESVRSHKKAYMYNEAKLKFWAYQQLKNI